MEEAESRLLVEVESILVLVVTLLTEVEGEPLVGVVS